VSRPNSTSPFAGIAIGELLRKDGPFELWTAEHGGRALMLRRVSEEFRSSSVIRGALRAASEVAQRVAHENVVLCHGAVVLAGEEVQVSERLQQIELERLANERFDPRLATWIARQLLEAIVHAGSLEVAHNNITPRSIYATLEGAILLDFGMMRTDPRNTADQTSITGLQDAAYEPMFVPDGRPHPPRDLYAIAAIWFELLTGVRYIDAVREQRGEHPRTELAPAIDHALGRALDGHAKDPLLDARAFASTLARIFYVDLDADDQQHGSSALSARVSSAIGIAPIQHIDPAALTNPDAGPPRGTFTRMLEERARPVEPKPLSMDDRDSGVVDPDTWAPDPSLAPRVLPGRTPTIPDALAPIPMANMASYSATLSPSFSAQGPLVSRAMWPIWVKWFLLGFVVTFLGLRLFNT
jgi:serine/threonine protein kinase